MRNGHLPSFLGWIAYKHKLWPSVRYGIGVMTNDIEEADILLDKQDHETMNCLGIASTIKKGWRKLHSTFGGVGLFNFIDEQLIERLNLLQQHYENGSLLSKKLSISLAYLQLQLGTNVCPFDLDYDRWSLFAPLSWVKMLWRTLHVCGFELHLRYDEMTFPRRRDRIVMEMAMEMISDKNVLESIARVRGFLNVIFLSDIVTADGKFLEQFACEKTSYLCRSKFVFPKECPSDSDWEAWCCFWSSWTVGTHELPSPLGEWISPSHRLWEWHLHDNGKIIYRNRMDGRYDKYVKTNDRGHRFHLVTMVEDRGKCSPISVKMHNGNCVRYRSTAELMPEVEATFDTFWDVLKEGGGEWMWEFVEEKYKEDDMDWLREGMINGTLV